MNSFLLHERVRLHEIETVRPKAHLALGSSRALPHRKITAGKACKKTGPVTSTLFLFLASPWMVVHRLLEHAGHRDVVPVRLCCHALHPGPLQTLVADAVCHAVPTSPACPPGFSSRPNHLACQFTHMPQCHHNTTILQHHNTTTTTCPLKRGSVGGQRVCVCLRCVLCIVRWRCHKLVSGGWWWWSLLCRCVVVVGESAMAGAAHHRRVGELTNKLVRLCSAAARQTGTCKHAAMLRTDRNLQNSMTSEAAPIAS